ncbi:Mob1 family protein [Cryptococcus gattii EJB2]|uniref:Mob1 family protein n=1 Tax=Cryptococcus gattii EJB2 TaxID=1296103 RepID=A0ABR5BY40_9TREE|nr:Mob1 family protein [Cryptococcus gattii EJB2]KJE03500.1 Mob1 family protein [Cryptococcus gattii NT-10]
MIIQPPQGAASYRLKRGTKLAEVPPQPPTPSVPPLSTLNGPFQLAEYLALKVKHDPHDVNGLVKVPVGDGSMDGKGPDRDVWIYEHLRRIPIDLTPLVTALLPICTRETCPQMRSSEWSYFCVAHGSGTRECSTIDYILHTLDSTVTLLNNPKHFPSRMHIPPASISHFPSIFRRLSRIFSHAYFHHRETFIMAEVENSLYARFVELCEAYELVGERLLVIPKEVVSKFRDDEEEDIGRDQGKEKASTHDEKEDVKEPVKLFNGTSNLPTSGSSTFVHNQTLGRGKTARPTPAGDKDVAEGSSSSNAANTTGAMGEEENEEEEDQREERRRSRSDSVSSLQSADSVQTAVHISDTGTLSQDVETEHVEDASPPHVAEVGTKEEKEDVEEVPKDEIDLLEDERNLEKEASVAPVPTAEEPKEEEAGQGETKPVDETEPAEESVQPISDDQVALEGSKKGESSGVKQDKEADKVKEAKLNGVKSDDGEEEIEATSSGLPFDTPALTEVIPVIESSSFEPAITSKTSVQPESKTVESASQEEQTPADPELGPTPTGGTSSEPSSESESGTDTSPLSPALSPTTSSAEEKEDDKKGSLSKKRAKKAAQKARAKEREREAKAQAQAQAEAEAPESSTERGKLEG